MERRVLDTSALMSGRHFEGELYTTEAVHRELRRQEALSPSLEAFLQVKVRTSEPERLSLERVRERAEQTGDAHRLSLTDEGLLALASDLDAILVTDDYSIQNLASVLGLRYEGVMEPGITERVRWRYRCTGCGERYESWHEGCPKCGSALRTARVSSERA